jgi:hypothetical protein
MNNNNNNSNNNKSNIITVKINNKLKKSIIKFIQEKMSANLKVLNDNIKHRTL